MNVSSVRPGMLSRPQAPAGSATSAAMDKLVPGEFPQVEQDLAAFPQPTLNLLSRYGIQVAILGQGQTLADAAGLRTLTAEENAKESVQANQLVKTGVAKAFEGGINTLAQLEEAADGIARQLRGQGLDHTLAIGLSEFSLDALAERRNIPVESVADWKQSFATLNQELVSAGPEELRADFGIMILPHTYRDGQAVPEIRLRNAGQVSAEYVEGSLGLNRSDERMVLLHEKFLGAPATELGNYRLAVHEVGHALDYALENLRGVEGFGQTHRDTVDRLYEADMERMAALGGPEHAEQVFTSERADDDVREYFAEAVEAYLTPANPDGFDNFRAGNSREGLLAKNPELFDYVDKVLNTDFPENAVPDAPKRQLAPPGFPDPDLELFLIR